MFAPVTLALELLSDAVATLDPHHATGDEALDLYRMFVTVDRLSIAAKTLLATRIDRCGIWRD